MLGKGYSLILSPPINCNAVGRVSWRLLYFFCLLVMKLMMDNKRRQTMLVLENVVNDDRTEPKKMVAAVL